MAIKLQQISEASLEVERSKVEVQLRQFDSHMAYQMRRDERLHESSMLAHENAWLSILKQHEMVQVLQTLAVVLGMGMQNRSPLHRQLHDSHMRGGSQFPPPNIIGGIRGQHASSVNTSFQNVPAPNDPSQPASNPDDVFNTPKHHSTTG